MNENSFNTSLAAGLRSQGIWAHKLPDLARAVTKPCDVVANCHGRFWMIEGKLKKVKLRPGAIAFQTDMVVIDSYEKTFRPNQIPNLKMIADQGGVGFVGIYLAEDRPGSQLKRAWLWPIRRFLTHPHWTLDLLTNYNTFKTHELTWKARVGWTASEWLVEHFGPPR